MKFMYEGQVYDDDLICELLVDCGADEDFPEYFNERHTPWELVKRRREDLSIDPIIEDDYEKFAIDFIHGGYADYDVECIED